MWTESRGRLPTYLLVRGLGLNVVMHAKFLFFLRKRKCRTYLPDVKENGGPKIKFERLKILNIVVGEKLIDSLVKRLENEVERLFNHEIGKLEQSR